MRRGLRLNCRLAASPRSVSFGGAGSLRLGDQKSYERYYAFAVAEGARPRVFNYETDADGLEAVSNLIRSEEVLAVVRGCEAQFAELSVVEMSIGGKRLSHRLNVKEQRW